MANSSSPRALLGLLVAMLLVSIGAVALIVNVIVSRPGKDSLAGACGPVVTTAVNQKLDTLGTIVCPEVPEAPVEDPFVTVKGTSIMPGFSYPTSWDGTGKALVGASTGELSTVDLSPDFIYYCEGCDGPIIAVRIQTQTRATFAPGAASIETYLRELHTGDKNLVLTSKSQGNGTLYTISGSMEGLFKGDFEELYYLTEKNAATVRFMNVTNVDLSGVWEKIKPSLDFSTLE